jgi:hypothetical protein
VNISVTVPFPWSRIGDFGMSERELTVVPFENVAVPNTAALCDGRI